MQFKQKRLASRSWRRGAFLLAACIVAIASLPDFHFSPARTTSPGAEILIDARIVSVRVTIS